MKPPGISFEIVLGLDDLARPLDEWVAAKVGAREAPPYRLIKRSIDARKGRPIRVRHVVELGAYEPPRRIPPAVVLRGRKIVVVGSGPAGTFAALHLAEAGAEVTIVERGKAVQPRRHDLARLVRRGELAPDSNYCFGEGGAGTFSDGKLYTRTKDRAAVDEVLGLLVEHGADPDIRVDHRPHVGSNKLPLLLQGMRARLEGMGVRYLWEQTVTGLTAGGVSLAGGGELPADQVVLAVGHSARDTYERLVAAGVACEARPFAIGVRVEHPQPLIDEIQYGREHEHPLLPAAFYHVTAQVGARGVWSFCMCPGGWIVNSSTEPERLATNGMSLKRRDSPYANAALAVSVLPQDWAGFGDGPLAGMALQREVEARMYTPGFRAPAQRLVDFARGVPGAVGRSSYRPGIVAADLAALLPEFLATTLRAAIPQLDRTMRGFLAESAQLVGVETRTSAPLRFLRDETTLASPSHPRLYPVGEGAGYAGGIVSAAIDGLRAARAITAR